MIDSHCHIAGPEFAADLDAVIERARAAGLAHVLVILAADDDAELAQADQVSSRWDGIRFSIGIHPHAAGRFASDPASAVVAVDRAMAAQPLTRGLGEIGLDYHYDFAPRAAQQEVFRHQLRLASARGLPVVIHAREADDDAFRILGEQQAASQVRGVFHSFTGDRAAARRALDLGFHISLSGIVTFRRALELQDVAKLVPADRLLIETDSPFLAPVPYRGTRNEPSHVVRVAEVVGQLRATTAEEIARVALENFRALFNP